MSLKKPKIIRITTVGFSLNKLLQGQLNFLNQFFEIIAISNHDSYLEEVRNREKVRIHGIRMSRKINLLNDLLTLFRFWIFFIREKPQIIHSNTPKSSLLSMIAGFFSGIPIRIYTVSGLRFEGFTGIRKRLFVFLEKITCLFATEVIPEGKGVKNKLIDYSITNKPLVVIHNGNLNGVDTDFYSLTCFDKFFKQVFKKDNAIEIEDVIYLFVGRVVKDKGIVELVNSFIELQKTNKKITLLLVGPYEEELDPLPMEIKGKIASHPKIQYMGYQEDVRPFMAAADIFVLPSYREGFPNTILQAGAMELPSIVTNISGSNEIIIHQFNGLIVPVKNESYLHDAMEMLLNDCTLRKKLAINARSRVKGLYDSKDVWDEIKNRYFSLLSTS